MVLTPSQKLLGNVAGVVGILQGLAWTCMSLICIIVYYLNYTIDTSTITTYSQQLNYYLYQLYLNKEQSTLDTRIIRPRDFIIMMWIYFFLSVILSTASCDLLYTIRRNKNRQCKELVIWGIIIGFISIIDLVFAALLLRDFINIPNAETANPLYRTTIGIVMTLAARGFTLWVVNIFLACFTIYYGLQIITHNKVKNALSDMSIPRVKITQQPSTPSIYSGTPVSESSMFQNTPKDYPSFINNGNKFTY